MLNEIRTLPRRKAPEYSRARANSIIARRVHLMAEMASLQAMIGAEAHSIKTARALLTLSWGPATWRAREQIIKSVRWLICLEIARAPAAPR